MTTNKGDDMELMLCLDGVEKRTYGLEDTNDAYNKRVERAAMDAAYHLKELNPDSIVSIVIVTTPLDGLLATGAMQVGLGR